MQKVLSFFTGFVLFTIIFSCNQIQDPKQFINQKTNQIPKLQVLYFHPTIRCATCNAVENNTIKLLKENFYSEIENGNILFYSYNLEEDANKALIEKYQISFSSLLIVTRDGLTDFTDEAFKYAQVKPLKFAQLLKAEITKNLK